MEVMYPRCCGLDVHKSSITACILLAQSGKPLKHIRRFGCTTRELRELVVWLQEYGIEQVAMESTGVYWKPVWNVLESHFQIVLANAQHIKAVPGRKTDTKDCQWIAELLQHGLLRGSFRPPLVIRDLRDLTRARTSLSQEHSRIASRNRSATRLRSIAVPVRLAVPDSSSPLSPDSCCARCSRASVRRNSWPVREPRRLSPHVLHAGVGTCWLAFPVTGGCE